MSAVSRFTDARASVCSAVGPPTRISAFSSDVPTATERAISRMSSMRSIAGTSYGWSAITTSKSGGGPVGRYKPSAGEVGLQDGLLLRIRTLAGGPAAGAPSGWTAWRSVPYRRRQLRNRRLQRCRVNRRCFAGGTRGPTNPCDARNCRHGLCELVQVNQASVDIGSCGRKCSSAQVRRRRSCRP